MIEIKFSHTYVKMPSVFWSGTDSRTWLIGVSDCNLDDLPDEFVNYDTAYSIGDNVGYVGYFHLPCGRVLVLTLMTDDSDVYKGCNIVWTTVRRSTPEKKKYYESAIGQEVKIVIETPKEIT